MEKKELKIDWIFETMWSIIISCPYIFFTIIYVQEPIRISCISFIIVINILSNEIDKERLKYRIKQLENGKED